MQIYTILLAFVVCLWPRSVLRHYTKILLFGGEREHAVLQISYSLVILKGEKDEEPTIWNCKTKFCVVYVSWLQNIHIISNWSD